MYLDTGLQALYDILLFDKSWFDDLYERMPGFSVLGECLERHDKCIKCFNEERWYEIYDFLDGNGFIVEWPDPDSPDINTFVILWPQYRETEFQPFESSTYTVSTSYYVPNEEIQTAYESKELKELEDRIYPKIPIKWCFQNSKNIKVVREAARPPP